MSRIYLTGATGRIGKKILEKIPDAVPLVRHESGLENETVVNFSDSEELKKVLADASVLVHIAGSVKTYDRNELWKSNYELTKRLMEALPENARIVYASTISVYGKKMAHNPADENTPVNPDTEYAKSKWAAERVVAGHPDRIIIRIGTVYGPEFEDYFNILRLLEKGKMAIIGEGTNRVSFVDVDDVAEVFRSAVSKGKGIYVVSGECRSQREIYKIACRELGVAMPESTISVGMAGFAARLNELKASVLGKKAKFTREHVAILSSDRCFNCNKARRELGFSPRDIEKGISELVEIYKNRQRSSTES